MGKRRPAWLAEDERTWDHIRIHERVLMHPDTSVFDLAVYAVLCWHANAATGESKPGQPTIAAEAKCSPRKVRDAIHVLETIRLIDVIRVVGKPIVYRLLAPPKDPIRMPLEEISAACGAAPTPACGAVLQIGPWHEVPQTPACGATVQIGPRHVVPQNNKEESFQKEPEKNLNPLEERLFETDESSNPQTAKPAPKREPDPLWDALVASLHWNPKELTKPARGSISAALRDLREVDATPEEVERRASRYRAKYPNAALTPNALAKHWSGLSADIPLPVSGSKVYRDADVWGERPTEGEGGITWKVMN